MSATTTTTTADSPTTPFLFLPRVGPHMDLILPTQPFYSMFYYTDDPDTRTGFAQKTKQGADKYTDRNKTTDNGRTCRQVFRANNVDPRYEIYDKLPFSIFSASGKGSANLYLLLVVFIATLVLGVITISYWTYLLGNNPMDDDFQNAIGSRSVYLSVLFIFMSVVLSILFYEFFTLKFLSLPWFRGYEADEPTNFYEFLLNTRKIVLWVFVMTGLAIVCFVTITLSKRPEQFTKQIVFNVVALVVLFCAQYLYYQNPSSHYLKTFSLLMSVSVIGFVMYLLYFF